MQYGVGGCTRIQEDASRCSRMHQDAAGCNKMQQGAIGCIMLLSGLAPPRLFSPWHLYSSWQRSLSNPGTVFEDMEPQPVHHSLQHKHKH